MQQLDFSAGSETCGKRRSQKGEVDTTCTKTDYVGGQIKSGLKRERLTEIGRRAGLVGLWELYYHLVDTEKKWSGL